MTLHSRQAYLRLLVAATVTLAFAFANAQTVTTFAVPTSVLTSTAISVDPSLLSISIEFFAFPGYTELSGTTMCLANIQTLRGAAPAVRIGGTTQDRASYDASLSAAVNYTIAVPGDAPESLTYGPSFFSLANELPGDVTIGLNRQLNNISNTQDAAEQAVKGVRGLLALELGNEPEFYAAGSPIIPPGEGWSPTTDAASQKGWFSSISSSVGNIFQAAVYLQYPTWSTTGLIPLLGDAITFVKTFSGHSYPQSACGGAATNLETLMSHSGIVSYTKQYSTEANSAHARGKRYFLGETNSATCGGGGISPTFGAGLWVMDYVLQGALAGVDRLYFHQGTIGNCAYCFWGEDSVLAPYYGAFFVSDFLGSSPKTRLTMIDSGDSSIGAYAVFSGSSGPPARVLLYNSEYFSGLGIRSVVNITLTDLGSDLEIVSVKRMTAPNATSLAGAGVTIGGGGTFSDECAATGTQALEVISASGGMAEVSLHASEAVIVYLSI
ncbi:hypothetical protein EW145_g2135 [Phellinidium pouzarii]|uniref:Beta-glucuronidase C-terminal domain-containing protein n=1 Tax=Phellinidium pouzarii TaxID=167371 RepID=A0A4S4LBZ7_9AGAM|nr:hypothetical protein EW145_g2135 [Phellinidium pouzarii]